MILQVVLAAQFSLPFYKTFVGDVMKYTKKIICVQNSLQLDNEKRPHPETYST